MANAPEPLSAEHLAALDARYRSPWLLETWLEAGLEAGSWESSQQALATRRQDVDETKFAELRERLLRQAAIETGALEGLYETEPGFTRTVAAVATDWVARIEEQKGVDVARLVTGQREAYELALDLATQRRPISEAVIRQLHELVCSGQDTYDVATLVGPQTHRLVKGSYKAAANHVLQPDGTEHAYAPVDRTPDEMRQLVEALRDPRFADAHPAVQAGFAHHSFVVIHPFGDGNGRVARVLASIFLLRATSLPIVLFADDRDRYLQAIRAADGGEVGRFSQFVADRTVDTMLYLVEEIRGLFFPDPLATTRQLKAALEGPAGLTHAEIDAIAERLRSLVRDHLTEYVSNLQLPPGVEVKLGSRHGRSEIRTRHREVHEGNTGQPMLVLTSRPPVEMEVNHSFDVLVATDLEAGFPLRVEWVGAGDADHVDFRLDDIYPRPRSAAENRLHAWLDNVLNEILAIFVADIEAVAQLGRPHPS